MESLGKIGKQGYDLINQIAADYGRGTLHSCTGLETSE